MSDIIQTEVLFSPTEPWVIRTGANVEFSVKLYDSITHSSEWYAVHDEGYTVLNVPCKGSVNAIICPDGPSMIRMFATTGGWSPVPIMGPIRADHSGSSDSSEDSEDKHPDSKRQIQKVAKNAEDLFWFIRMGRRSRLRLLSLATTWRCLVA